MPRHSAYPTSEWETRLYVTALRRRRLLPRPQSIRADLLTVAALAVSSVLVWNLIAGGRTSQTAATAALALIVLTAAFGAATVWPIPLLMAGWAVAVVQQPLGAYVGAGSAHGAAVVGRLDDAIILMVALAAVARAMAGANPREAASTWVLALLCTLLALGVLAAIHRQDIGIWTIVGAWLSLKIWVTIATCLTLPWRKEDYDRVTRLAIILGVLVAGLAIVDYVSASTLHTLLHTRFTPNDPNQPARAHYVQSVFESPSRYSNFMTIVFAIAVSRYVLDRRRSYLLWACLFGAGGLASLRLRGLLAAVAVVAVLIGVVREGRLARFAQLTVAMLACVAVLGPAAFTGQVDKFAEQTSSTARGQLYAGAFELADDNFPFGVGFGRYGSYASGLYYSPIYDQIGLSYEFGFSRDNPDFLTDAAVSGFIAEMGVLGAVLFLVGLVVLGWRLALRARTRGPTSDPATVALAILVAAVVMSIASAALLDSVVILPLAMLVGMAFRNAEGER